MTMKPIGLTRTLAGLTVAMAWVVLSAIPGSAAGVVANAVGPADRDLLVRVRLAGLWEQPAGLAAQERASSEKVRDVGAKIANEHHDLDEAVRGVAAQLGVELPDTPSAEQQGWLDELATAQGEEFDRVFVERLRAAHGKVFPVIAGVRAGTRNDLVRDFATTANTYVLRHLAYLDGTGLVNYATLPTPSATVEGLADGIDMTADGALGPADRDLLVRIRQAGLWEQPAGLAAQQRGTSPTVRAIGEQIANEDGELDGIVRSVATQLGVTLPDHPNADQRDWLSEIETAQGEDFDRVFIERLRAASGSVLPVIAYVRAGTRNNLVRAMAATANDAVVRHMTYLESSGLVDYNDLPRPPPPSGIRATGLDRDGGVNPIVIWLVLAAAAIAGAVAVGRLARSR
jgi:predicted outer membrane protein